MYTYIFYPTYAMASSSVGANDFNVCNITVTYVEVLWRGQGEDWVTGSSSRTRRRGIFIITTVRSAAILDYLYAIKQ